MSDVTLIARSDFSYATRRLKAGDSFAVPAPMARVLVGIKKAEYPREIGHISPPPARVIAKAVEVVPAKAEAGDAEGRTVSAVSTRSTPTKRRRSRRASAKK